jgi:hypothetical protein
MSGASWYSLNQRVNSLQAQINKIPIPPAPPFNLYALLAGTQSFTGVNTFTQLPESVVVPIADPQLANKKYVDDEIALIGIPNLQQVVDDGNSISNFIAPSTATITSTNFTNNRQLLLNANADPTIKMIDNLNASHFTTFDIDTLNLNGVSTNWSSIVAPAVPNLGQVLTAGSSAIGNSIFAVNQLSFNDNTSLTSGQLYFPNNGVINGVDTINMVNSGSITGVNQINSLPYPPTISGQNLSSVLSTGNDAGGQSMTNVNNINLSTINNLPVGGAQNLNQVLAVGQSAGNQVISDVNLIQMQDAQTYLASGSLYFGNNNGVITGLQTINGSPYPPAGGSQNLFGVLSTGNDAGGQSITNVNNINLSTINGLFPGSSPNLQQVLAVGNFAGNQVIYDVNQLLISDSATGLTAGTLNFANNNGSISGLQTINGASYPPYPTSPYGLNTVLAINNDASGYGMTNVSSINGTAYPPPIYYPDLNSVLSQGNSAYHDIDMTNQSLLNVNTISGQAGNNLTLNTSSSANILMNSAYNTTINSVNNFSTTADSIDIIGNNGININQTNSSQTLNIFSNGSLGLYSNYPMTITGETITFYSPLQQFIFNNLPTSSGGLPTGALYNSGGFLMIAP